MKKHVLLAAWILAAIAVCPLRADDWKMVGSDDGITIYRRDVAGSAIIALKGEGLIDAPVWKVASVLLDTERAPEWVDSLKRSAVVRRLTPYSYIEYNHLGMPFILKDRDFVSEVQIDVNAAARSVALVYKPSADGSAPTTHDVRGEILAGSFRVTSVEAGRRAELTAELHCDPKGAIPAWVVNVFQKSWPRKTFEGIRRQVAKPDVAMPPEFQSILTPAQDF